MGKRLGVGLLCLLLFGGCGGKDMYYVETIGEVAGIGNEAQAYAEDKTRKKDAEYENLEAASSISGEYYYEEGTGKQSAAGEGMSNAVVEIISETAQDMGQKDEINSSILETPGTKTVDLSFFSKMLPGSEVRRMIEMVVYPELPYLNELPLTDGDRKAIEARRNLEGIPPAVEVSFGVLTDNTSVRSFPTWDKSSSEIGSMAFDYFQQTMLTVGEGVAVLHRTADGIWCFVQGETYSGWIETASVAFCSQAEMLNLSRPQQVLVALDQMKLENKNIRMGTVFALENVKEQYYTVRMPSKSEDGTLRIQYVQISKSEPVHEGYLPFEWNLILEQAGKLKGMPYGWGDTGGNMDCSSTMCSVYKCFGIRLPRDTSGQSLMCGIQLEGLAAEEKQEILRGLKPGTLLYMPGHVMMYLGEEEGEPRILHNVTAYSENGDTIYAQQCCITGLDIMRMNGESYWDSLTGAWELCTEP